jgi:hypothetical protein
MPKKHATNKPGVSKGMADPCHHTACDMLGRKKGWDKLGAERAVTNNHHYSSSFNQLYY